jgi:hypothetical protein
LTSVSNAHAKTPESTTEGYVDVCFGDLICSSSLAGCVGDDKEILRLSSETNAHIEKGNAYASAEETGYEWSICCTIPDPVIIPPTATIFDNLRWEDYTNVEITESYVGNTVKLVARTNLPVDTEVTFEIFEDDLIFDDEIRTGENALTGIVSAGVVETDWLITEEDLELTVGRDKFFFTVRETEGTETVSGADENIYLSISEDPDPDDDPPTVSITGDLIQGGVYFVDVPILFDQESFDAEGPIENYEWKVVTSGGVLDEEVDPNDASSESFTQTFENAGQRTITLRVTDSSGQISEEQLSILVLGSPGVFAFIDEPTHKQVVVVEDRSVPEDGILDYSVDINTKGSYFVSDSGTGVCPTLTCEAGSCPLETENVPVDCTPAGGEDFIVIDVPDPVGSLNILDFKWKTSLGTTFGGPGISSRSANFVSGSSQINDKWIELTLDDVVEAGEISIAEPETFRREFTLGQCVDEGDTFLVIDEEGSVIGFECRASEEGGDEFFCYGIPPDSPQSCAEILNEDDCNRDISVYLRDPLYVFDDDCKTGTNAEGNPVRCRCKWDLGGGSGGFEEQAQCRFVKTVEDIEGPVDENPCTLYSCTEDHEQTKCIDNRILISVDREFLAGTCGTTVDSGQCVDETFPIPCGLFSIELGFFDYIQFFITSIIIFVLYLFIYTRRKW